MKLKPGHSSWPFVLGLLILLDSSASASGLFRRTAKLEGRFAGQVLDFTANHGTDRRVWSESLQEKRDLYVYLPPGFNPCKRYPLIIWLHGILQDERGLLEDGLPQLDLAMTRGQIPPAIIAIPDGSLVGRPGYFVPHSAFLNSNAGRFADFLFKDIYPFVCLNFPIRPEREAHVLAGVSIGAGSAFHHAIARRKEFGVVMGIFPPLNIRWLGCHERYFGNFTPECWGWREHYHLGLMPVAKFYGGLVSIPLRRFVAPLYGEGNQVVEQMSRDNPIEMLDRYDVREGQLQMLVAYGGKDQFNTDAQVESFLCRSRERGLTVDVLYDPRGRHDTATALSFIPDIVAWLAQRLEPFHPDR